MPSKAYYEGYSSYGQGVRARDNPYRQGTYSNAEWFTGWNAAREGKSKHKGLRQ